MKKKLLVLIISLFSFLMFSQESEKGSLNIKIDQVCSDQYPNMTAFVSVRNSNDEIVTGLAPGLFMTRIDSEELNGKLFTTAPTENVIYKKGVGVNG